MSHPDATGTVFDIQHFSVSDGPGIRTTIFFKGCPLHCLWCHNPESYESQPQLMFVSARCAACGLCTKYCDNGGHRIENGVHQITREPCIACGSCAAHCPNQALSLAGKQMSVQEVLDDVLEDRFFYESSGGGITLSGGEPMFQPEFALALARAAGEAGLHTAIETSGFCSTKALLEIAPFIDLFLFDYKATGEESHRACTGVSQEPILKNLHALDEAGAAIILRCPMVPGYNLNDAHAEGIAALARTLSHLQEIHLEPYHNIGISKREGLGMDTESAHITPPDQATLKAFASRIESLCDCTVKIM